jgi:hypothetical protein
MVNYNGHLDGSTHFWAIGHCVTNEGPSLLLQGGRVLPLFRTIYKIILTMHFEAGTVGINQSEPHIIVI